MELGVVTEKTLVITTVHESQIVDDLSLDLMTVHDLPVDVIVTPKRIVNVRRRQTSTALQNFLPAHCSFLRLPRQLSR